MTVGIRHLALGLLGYRTSVLKLNASFKEQLEPSFHQDEVTFWHGFQLVDGHERSLNHLQRP